jgi:hypothetical protein
MFLVVPTFVARCHYVRKEARDPDDKIWNCEREGWPIKGVASFVRYAVRDFYMEYPRVRHIHVNNNGFESAKFQDTSNIDTIPVYSPRKCVNW